MANEPRDKISSDVSTAPLHDVRNDSLNSQLWGRYSGELLKEHFNYSELKRRLKAEQKAKEKAEKEAKAAEAKEQAKGAEKKIDLEEEISANVSCNMSFVR